jgi:hypothetical protein
MRESDERPAKHGFEFSKLVCSGSRPHETGGPVGALAGQAVATVAKHRRNRFEQGNGTERAKLCPFYK